MIRLLLCLCLTCAVMADVVAQEAATRLPQVIVKLVEAQAQVQSACSVAAVTVPAALTDVLIVRRTIAADWQRRLESGNVRGDDPALARFTSELESLVAGLQQLANLAQQLGDAPRRFPHCLTEPAYARYRTLVGDAVAQGMQAVSAGRLRDQVAPAAWYQRQARHTTLLTLIEAGHQADERYGSLPRDDRWLIEYREHLLLTRATLERTLELTDQEQVWEHQDLLEAYTRLLDTRVHLAQRSADCGLPMDAVEIATFRLAGEAQVQALGRLVVLARSRPAADEDGYWQRHQQEERVLARAQRLTDMANQWLAYESERREQLASLADSLEEAPAELAQARRTTLAGFTAAQRGAQERFHRAVADGDVDAAIAARHAMERVRTHCDRLWLHLDEDLAIAAREQAWRALGTDPVIAEKLRQWDERRAAALAARAAADEAADRAVQALQAAELAELASERAQEHADQAREVEERHDLSELIDALDEMVELRTGQPPGQEQ